MSKDAIIPTLFRKNALYYFQLEKTGKMALHWRQNHHWYIKALGQKHESEPVYTGYKQSKINLSEDVRVFQAEVEAIHLCAEEIRQSEAALKALASYMST